MRHSNGMRIYKGRWMNGAKLVARQVMEDILGRPLTSEEHVHHKDGDTLNDSPENLELLLRRDHSITHGRKEMTEAEKKHQSKVQSESWTNPEIRKRRLDGQREAYARRRILTTLKEV